jgi:hypothetical protein
MSNVTLGNLVAGSSAVMAQEEYEIMAWESRILPLPSLVQHVLRRRFQCTALADEKSSRELDSYEFKFYRYVNYHPTKPVVQVYILL